MEIFMYSSSSILQPISVGRLKKLGHFIFVLCKVLISFVSLHQVLDSLQALRDLCSYPCGVYLRSVFSF